MRLKIIKRLIGISLILTIAAGISSAQKPVGDEAEIRRVIENFRTSLIKKDKPLFLNLFLEGSVGWQSVTEDASLLRLRARQPQAVKVAVNPKDNHLSFIDFIVGTEKRTEETFAAIKISTDGDVASVGFDYAFIYDNRETNHGREHWLLVRTADGWKITAVVWSETLPPTAGQK